MNLFQRLLSSIGLSGNVPNNNDLTLLSKTDKKSLLVKLRKTQPLRVKMDLDRLRLAILAAENPINPNRNVLYAIYKQAMRDGHVYSQTRTIANKVLSSNFTIEKDGKADDELKKILRRPWMNKYIKYWIEHIWYGHSLVEFCQKVDSNSKLLDKEFNDVTLIPREHVHPWDGQIVIDPNHIKGLPYRDKKFANLLMEIGDADDLGLLLIVAEEVIYKRYSRADWSRHSEKFGMPFTVIKTSSRNEKEIDAKAEMAANMGSNGWAVLDDQDEVNLVESSKTDSYKIYMEGINLAHDLISKIVAGQTGTSDEKSFVGSAEVHERILNTYTVALLIALQDHINFELLPFLVRNGYPLTNCELKFVDVTKYFSEKQVNDEPTPDPEPVKKKLSFNPTLQSLYKTCGCSITTLSKKLLNFGNVEQLIAKAAKNIYDKKLVAGSLDKELWLLNVTRLVEAVQEGIGKKYHQITFEDKDYDLMMELRQNIYSFAAFKNHSNIKAMIDALLDEDGKVVSFSVFKEKAEQIGKVYNVNWLETEYKTAIGQADMAVKWKDIERDKETLPLLQYDAVNDDRTRPAHAALDGVTLPVDDPFWDEFFPPNGWNCRCTTRQLASGDIKKPAIFPTEEETPLSFRNNAGKTGKLYSEEHPYFKQTTKKVKDQILKTVQAFIDELDHEE